MTGPRYPETHNPADKYPARQKGFLSRSEMGDVQTLRRARIKEAWDLLEPEDRAYFRDLMDPEDLTMELVRAVEDRAYRGP